MQQALHRDPHAGDLYVFRGRRGNLVKVLWHDDTGMSLLNLLGSHQILVLREYPEHEDTRCVKRLLDGELG